MPTDQERITELERQVQLLMQVIKPRLVGNRRLMMLNETEGNYFELHRNEIEVHSEVDDPSAIRLSKKHKQGWGGGIGKVSFTVKPEEGGYVEHVLWVGERSGPNRGGFSVHALDGTGTGDDSMAPIERANARKVEFEVPLDFGAGQVGDPPIVEDPGLGDGEDGGDDGGDDDEPDLPEGDPSGLTRANIPNTASGPEDRGNPGFRYFLPQYYTWDKVDVRQLDLDHPMIQYLTSLSHPRNEPGDRIAPERGDIDQVKAGNKPPCWLVHRHARRSTKEFNGETNKYWEADEPKILNL